MVSKKKIEIVEETELVVEEAVNDVFDTVFTGATFSVNEAKKLMVDYEYLDGSRKVIQAFNSVMSSFEYMLNKSRADELRAEVAERRFKSAEERILNLEKLLDSN